MDFLKLFSPEMSSFLRIESSLFKLLQEAPFFRLLCMPEISN